MTNWFFWHLACFVLSLEQSCLFLLYILLCSFQVFYIGFIFHANHIWNIPTKLFCTTFLMFCRAFFQFLYKLWCIILWWNVLTANCNYIYIRAYVLKTIYMYAVLNDNDICNLGNQTQILSVCLMNIKTNSR